MAAEIPGQAFPPGTPGPVLPGPAHPDPVFPEQYVRWMRDAIALADDALATSDVPVGAMVVAADGTVLGTGRNERELKNDPTAHAEVVALRQAARAVGNWHIADATLVVTLEPCVMCAGAILAARIPRVVFGAWDEKAGAAGSVYDVLRDRRLLHRVEVFAGVEAEDCARLLSDFFVRTRSAPPATGP